MKIEIKHLEKKYENATPLKNVNATINDGDVIAIIGPSGCGKSTLMRCINLLDPPTAGEIYVDGKEITKNKANANEMRPRMGMVFQSYNLFGHMTVIENVMFAPMEIKKMPRQEAYDKAMELLRSVGMEDRALKYPDELSGGQRQRVAIARTLAMEPELIFLDEPTSALDPTMVREVESVICKLAESGKTMMIVTHEMRLARAISNRVFYLDQGELYEDGPPEQIFENPLRERTRSFIQHLKVYRYKFYTHEFSYDDYLNKFQAFSNNNNIPALLVDKLRGATEQIVSTFVSSHVKDHMLMNMLIQYDADAAKANLLLYYTELDSASQELTQLLEPYTKSVQTESITDEDYNRKTTAEL